MADNLEIEDRLHTEILEAIHQFVGNDFSFTHNDEDGSLRVTEYTEEGEILRRHEVTIAVRIESTHG